MVSRQTAPLLGLAAVLVLACPAWAGDSEIPTDFATVQEAIDDPGTVAGDTITITAAASPHVEDAIRITKSVTIAGDGIGATVLLPGAGGYGFFVDADDVTIRDLAIIGGSQGIRFDMAGSTIDGTTIERVRFLAQDARGVELQNFTTVTGLLVDECVFEVFGNTGFRISSEGHLEGALFRDTVFSDNNIGIYLANDGNTSTLKDVEVTGCTFSASRGAAIYLEEAQDLLIEGNTFIDNHRDVELLKWYQASVPMSNVTIIDNTMTGTTDAVFSVFNAEDPGSGQTVLDGISFELNTCLTADGSAVFAGGHSFSGGLGGVGWDTVSVNCNDFLGILSLENGVRFFNPGGVASTALLGGTQTIDVLNNWWGTSNIDPIIEVLAITDFCPFRQESIALSACPSPGEIVPFNGFDVNPVGSLIPLTAALPTPGTTIVLGVDNPFGTQAVGSVPIVGISSEPGFGILLAGFGMSAPGALGEILISILPPNPFEVITGTGLWAGPGSPAPVLLPIPDLCTLSGVTVYTQGLLLDLSPGALIPIGLTDGLAITIGS